jgi:endonuclease/exonuclease/phosphatase family metal-dependent hydrolase
MIDRFEILASKIRHLVSRNRWSARLLGYEPVMGHEDEPGLILVQIDGLGEEVLRCALADGQMPFTRHLVDDEGYRLHSLYSGLTSNTPGFQAELFHGVKGAVPAFGFRDRELDRFMSMNNPSAAAEIEKRLLRRGPGLLRGGSIWSSVFSGGAAESHLCASTVGPDDFLRALNPLRVLGLVVWHGWSVVRVLANLIAELGLAIWDFVRGTFEGWRFMQELRFVPERVLITAVMREIVTAGTCIDAERGMPVIHVNFLGYDEHGHRRGPDSRFARWTLRGIDRAVRRIWLASHRSPFRDYQVWIFSDHGQEPVVSYATRHGEGVRDAVRRVCREFRKPTPAPRETPRRVGEDPPTDTSERSRWLRRDLPEWMNVPEQRAVERPGLEELPRDGDVEVTDRGPVGLVYLPEDLAGERLLALAEAVSRDARVPTVLVRDGDGGAWAWKDGGHRSRLPEDAEEIFGADHPHLESVTEDILRLVEHESAGSLVLLGWDRRGCMSFKSENGAHGGPGPRETSAFLVVPPEMTGVVAPHGVLRPLDMRKLVQRVLDPREPHLPLQAARGPTASGVESIRIRLMTYNVHGCRGMDGRYSTQRIARVIARARPDVICLQELDQSRGRSGGIDQIGEIARQLQSDFHFHAVSEQDDGRFGNAILSHFPMERLGSGQLPRVPSTLRLEDRGVLWVEIELEGASLQVLNTHLSILARERRAQVDALVRDWLEDPGCRAPVVLAGDFNSSSFSYTSRRIGDVLHDVSDLDVRARAAGERIQHTWSGRVPVRRIDHVFTSGDLSVASVRVPRTRLSRVASDHLPLVVDLSVPKAEHR